MTAADHRAAVLDPRGEAAPGRRREVREVMTPEGVPITFALAPLGDRAGAVLLDLLFQVGAVLVVALLAHLSFGGGDGRESWLRPLVVVTLFLVLNFYFAFFELRWQGWTPGKRLLGIRVIDARGGPLEPSAVLGRNLLRELELWMPARFLLGGRQVWPDAPGWAWLLAGLWTLVFLLLPLFNRDRLRAGDLVAGTWVVVQPKPELLPDLAAADPPLHAHPRAAAVVYPFTDAQLAVYGEYELQVLERALRAPPGPERSGQLAAVAQAIRTKLKHDGPAPGEDAERFLSQYYAAVRGHLERRRLLGKRKVDKFS